MVVGDDSGGRSPVLQKEVMEQEEFESHDLRQEFIETTRPFFIKHNFTRNQVVAFLSAALVGTVHLNGFSQEEFDRFCDLLKEGFKSETE